MTFPMSYRKVKSKKKNLLSYDTFVWSVNTYRPHYFAQLCITFINLIKKLFEILYFDCTSTLKRSLWLSKSRSKQNIFLSFKTAGVHFRSVCLSYFEIHNLTVPKKFTLFSKHVTHWNRFIYSGVQCHIVSSSAN